MKRIRRYFLALICLTATASAEAQINAEQVITIGRNVLSMDDYMLAIQYFNQAIKAKPYLADPYFLRGLAKMSLEDYKGAEYDCTEALKRNKFKTEAYKLRGFARQHLGLDSLAIEDYNEGLKHDPTDRYFLFYKGVAQTTMKKNDEALETMNTLLRLYPRFEEGYAARASLYLQREDTVAALDDVEKAIKLNRAMINPYLIRADIESSRGNWDVALADMDEAVKLYPEEPGFYINRAYVRYNTDNYLGAMSDYNFALQLDPNNIAALFNRALLRFEVKDLINAKQDFTSVLGLNPQNFHALYNRGLVELEAGEYREALADFKSIAKRYPNFYPVYYAIAEAERNLGNLKAVGANVNYAENLVRKYVANPESNPLDRPTIAAGTPKNSNRTPDGEEEEDENEVMNRFNQLVTMQEIPQIELSFNERIKGRVQDRNVNAEPEPLYTLSFNPSPKSLGGVTNYFQALEAFNRGRYITRTIYLSPMQSGLSDEDYDMLFKLADNYTSVIASSGTNVRPADLLARGVAYSMLKNYRAAIEDFDKIIEKNPEFTIAYIARGVARYEEARMLEDQRLAMQGIAMAASDFDTATRLDPRIIHAWFNKGYILYNQRDYGAAAQCFTKAIELDPEFGAAYYNRGLCHLSSGKKNEAFVDLSRAGELGVLPSYNILKRMK
ncbi:MAG: tetratricopeptide repeat protein [Muribaculaceae bacterium]|nr:tetratricopeptide repeat protein [Muribaculaceae bacterium]